MMETIITEKAAIYVVNVSVSASSVSFVVDNLALDRDGSVRLHAIKIINQVFNFIYGPNAIHELRVFDFPFD